MDEGNTGIINEAQYPIVGRKTSYQRRLANQDSYSLDARNRLVGLRGGSVNASYIYGPENARISVTEGGVTSLLSVARWAALTK